MPSSNPRARDVALAKLREAAEHPRIFGYCESCCAWRDESSTRQEERDECCVNVCLMCGDVIDESCPF